MRCAQYPRHNDSLHILEDVLPVFAIIRRLVWHQVTHVARLDIRKHATAANVLQIIGYKVYQLLAYV